MPDLGIFWMVRICLKCCENFSCSNIFALKALKSFLGVSLYFSKSSSTLVIQ